MKIWTIHNYPLKNKTNNENWVIDREDEGVMILTEDDDLVAEMSSFCVNN